MEWLGVFLWVLAVALALPLAGAGALTSASLGVQSFLGIGGLALCVLYLALEGGRWMAWASGGLAFVAAAAIGAGAARLVSDEPRTSSAGQAAEEQAAMLAGLELPLLLTLAFVMGLAATGITTVR